MTFFRVLRSVPLLAERPRRLLCHCSAVALCLLWLAGCGSSAKSGAQASTASTASNASSSTSTSTTQATGQESPATLGAKYYKGYVGEDAGWPTSYPEPKPAHFAIGWMDPSSSLQQLQVQQEAAAAEVKRLGGTLVLRADSVANVDQQVTDFQSLIGAHVRGIAYTSVDPKATEPVELQAERKGIYVDAIDKTLHASEPPGYIITQVWQGRDEQAYATMKLMAQLAPHGKVGLITIGAPVTNIKYLTQRQAYWAKKFGLDVVGIAQAQSDDAAGGEAAAAGLVSRHAVAIACYIDTVCLGADVAARQAGQKIITVGIGGDQGAIAAVRQGNLTADFQVPGIEYGKQMVDALYDKLENPGKKLSRIVVVPALNLFTAQTVGQAQTWAQELASEFKGSR